MAEIARRWHCGQSARISWHQQRDLEEEMEKDGRVSIISRTNITGVLRLIHSNTREACQRSLSLRSGCVAVLKDRKLSVLVYVLLQDARAYTYISTKEKDGT